MPARTHTARLPASCWSRSGIRFASKPAYTRCGGASIDGAVITVRANAFLRGMMRAFASVLVAVGQGRHAPDWMHELLTGPESTAPPLQPAPAHGLHQWAVEYPWETVVAPAVAA